MAPGTPIPTHVLVLSEDFGEDLGAQRAGEAIAAGLLQAGAPAPEVCPVGGSSGHAGARELLGELGFDGRMRAARALILAVASLAEDSLAGSLAFEAATMARQAGVPCYAVTASNRLNAFDVRILDLQVVFEASTTRTLRGAGRRLGQIV
jgi:hypothetical protein